VLYKIEKQIDKMHTLDMFYEKLGKIELASEKEYFKISKTIKENMENPCTIAK
jgi:hypothetical protein